MQQATEDEILKLLATGKSIRDFIVQQPINLAPLVQTETLSFNQPIEIVNCHLYSLDAVMIHFQELVTIRDTIIEHENGSFMFSYFLKGVDIRGCHFQAKTDFQCGVHNQNNFSFTLQNNIFQEFVNFFDCQFDGPVKITGCTFKGGTNLLGNKTAPYRVTFLLPPQIENNVGDLELNGG